jgi:hypothetical protein
MPENQKAKPPPFSQQDNFPPDLQSKKAKRSTVFPTSAIQMMACQRVRG